MTSFASTSHSTLEASRNPWSFYSLSSLITKDDLEISNFESFPPENQVRIILSLLALKKVQLAQLGPEYVKLINYCLGEEILEEKSLDTMKDIESDENQLDKKENQSNKNQNKLSFQINENNENNKNLEKINKDLNISGNQNLIENLDTLDNLNKNDNIVEINEMDNGKTSIEGLDHSEIMKDVEIDSLVLNSLNDNLYDDENNSMDSWLTVISKIVKPYYNNHTLDYDFNSNESTKQVEHILKEIDNSVFENPNRNLFRQRHEIYMTDQGGVLSNEHCLFHTDENFLLSASKHLDSVLNIVTERKPPELSERIQRMKPSNIIPQQQIPSFRSSLTPLTNTPQRTPQFVSPQSSNTLPKKRTVMLLDNKPTKKPKLNPPNSRQNSGSMKPSHGRNIPGISVHSNLNPLGGNLASPGQPGYTGTPMPGNNPIFPGHFPQNVQPENFSMIQPYYPSIGENSQGDNLNQEIIENSRNEDKANFTND